MLFDLRVITSDQISDMIAELNGNNTDVIRHEAGVFEDGSLNFDNRLNYLFKSDGVDDFNCKYPRNIPINSYGVCDNYQQVLEQSGVADIEDRQFVISISPIVKANQDPEGGWRWHKWGPYIGNHTPQHQYLYDEPDIDMVYVYHIHELDQRAVEIHDITLIDLQILVNIQRATVKQILDAQGATTGCVIVKMENVKAIGD